MHKRNIFHLLFIFILFGCAQVTSLNLKKHQFGLLPTKIIWMQVAGLSPEHLSMLKFSYPSRGQETAFENSVCMGSVWEYNLFNIRPTAYSGFLSQLTGKKNIKGDCSDYEQKPIWKYIAPKGYKIGIFEGQLNKSESLLRSKSCKKSRDYLSDATFWSMNRPKGKSKTFHVNTKNNYKKGSVYFDKSCSSGECFTSVSRNIEGVFKQFSKNKKNYLFVSRNFKFKKHLLAGNSKLAREELSQINDSLKYFQSLAKKNSDVLVLLTSAEAYEVDFPRSGTRWKKFIKNGKIMRTRNSKLISSVFASGARSENFCGMYDQSQIMPRIFSGAKQQGLEFSIINPFK